MAMVGMDDSSLQPKSIGLVWGCRPPGAESISIKRTGRPLIDMAVEYRHWCYCLPRRETRWNLQGCPKLPNRSQPLVGRSSPYYQDM